MFKYKKIIAVISPLILLTSCDVTSSIKPYSTISSSSSGSISNSTYSDDPTNILSSLTGGILTSDLKEHIESCSKTLKDIRSVNVSYSSTVYSYENDDYDVIPSKTKNALNSKTILYDNSVLYTNITGSSFDDYKAFNYINDNERIIARYTYIINSFTSIETRTTYQNEVSEIKSTRKEYSIDYSPENYDKIFTIFDQSSLLNVGDYPLAIAGVLSNGNILARFLTKESEENIGSYTKISSTYQDFLFSSSNLVALYTYYDDKLMLSDSTLIPLKSVKIYSNFAYAKNGNFDLSQLPSLTETKINRY